MSEPQKLNTQIDLNNIDLNQIVQILTEYRNTALKLAVIIGALVVAGMMFNDCHTKEQVLRARISQVQQKLDVIASQQQAVKNLDDFKASFSKGINEDKIIPQITGYATAHGVSISSLSPTESQDMGLYDVIKVQLLGAAPDYKAMVLFLRDIEKSPYLFKVDLWEANGRGEVDFTMEISAVHVHI